MKNLIIILIVLLITSLQGFAATPATIGELETTVFGYENKSETDIKRVENIEEYLYGEKKQGNMTSRIESIQNDIGYVNKESVYKAAEKQKEEQIKQREQKEIERIQSIKEDSSVDYPIVDKMEQTLFKQDYKKENIYKRLDRLETKVFQKTSPKLALNDRVDNLSSVILPRKQQIKDDYDSYANQAMNDYNAQLPSVNPQSVPFQLAVLEQDILKTTYNNDNISTRLGRLEQSLFNRTFATDNDMQRLQRIAVTYEAKQNSYKYENNRKMQNMATVSQFGGILLMILAMLL